MVTRKLTHAITRSILGPEAASSEVSIVTGSIMLTAAALFLPPILGTAQIDVNAAATTVPLTDMGALDIAITAAIVYTPPVANLANASLTPTADDTAIPLAAIQTAAPPISADTITVSIVG